MTTDTGSAAIGGAVPAASCSYSDVSGAVRTGSGIVRLRLDRVSAELIAQRGEEAAGKGIVLARAVPREQGRRDRWKRHATIDGLLHRPAAFARVLDVRVEARQIGILRERAGGQIQQPGSDDAGVPPQIGDRREIDLVVALLEQFEALGVRLHQAVL